MSHQSIKSSRKMGLLSATSIGVGAMIGAGIFAFIGIAVDIAGSFAYLSFAFAGLIALLTVYSVSRLAIAFPSKGGRAKFLNEGFGHGIFAGGLNTTMWLGYIIVTALYARAFCEYGSALFNLSDDAWLHLLSSGVVLFFLLLNFVGAAIVGRAEVVIVAAKTAILLFFGFLGLTTLEMQNLSRSPDVRFFDIILAGGIVFMSYEGFGLVANTAGDIRKPKKNLPRGLYLSVVTVIVIYVLVAIAVIGNLSTDHIIEAKKYVLAEAAKPIIGSFGFTIMGWAALFSTASAINATIYGPVYMVQETARAGQLPLLFTKALFKHESGWALITTGLIILLVTNLMSLEAIAETGSLIFLVIYAAVNVVNLKLYKKTKSKRRIIWAALLGLAFSFGALYYFLIQNGNMSTIVFAGIIVGCFAFQWFYQKYQSHKKQGESS